MKLFIILSCLMFSFFSHTSAQEKDYTKLYENDYWSASDYTKAIDTFIYYTNFKFVKDLKSYGVKSIKAMFLNMTVEEIKQMNIDGEYYCSVKHEDCYNLWQLYYPSITKDTFDRYCKGLIVFMILDGVLLTK